MYIYQRLQSRKYHGYAMDYLYTNYSTVAMAVNGTVVIELN